MPGMKTRAYSDEQIDYIKKVLNTHHQIIQCVVKSFSSTSVQVNLDAISKVISDENATCLRVLDMGYSYVQK